MADNGDAELEDAPYIVSFHDMIDVSFPPIMKLHRLTRVIILLRSRLIRIQSFSTHPLHEIFEFCVSLKRHIIVYSRIK